MNEQGNTNLVSAKEAVIEIVGGRGKKALFATEVLARLRRFSFVKDEMDQALAELEAEGAVVVRDHFCADPHLAQVDLRVVALVDTTSGDEAPAAALHEIDLVWNKWLGEFLSNHRCG